MQNISMPEHHAIEVACFRQSVFTVAKKLQTFMSDGATENPKAALALSAAPIVISVGLMSSPTLPNTAPDGPIAIPVGEMTNPTADSTAPVADTCRMSAS